MAAIKQTYSLARSDASLQLRRCSAMSSAKKSIARPSLRPRHHPFAAPILSRTRDACIASAAEQEASGPMRAVEGDIVTLHWACINENGEVLESTRASDEPTTFEVGTGDIVGNRIFEAFDEAVRGLSIGDIVGLKVEGGPWQEELLFTVPRGHQEIERLEGRYKNQGGVQVGQVVELSNGGMAVVVACDDENVQLDANSMMAGKTLKFELELANLERPDAA